LCLFIVGLILLQGGAGDLSSAFGGGGQLDSALGVGAGRKMSKLTGWLGVSFLAIVTLLAIPSKTDLRELAGSPPPDKADAAAPVTIEPQVIPAEPAKDDAAVIGAPPAAEPVKSEDAAPADAAPVQVPAEVAPEGAPAAAEPKAEPAPAPVPESKDAAKPAGGKKLTLD
jgi:protein translocase SecG subunit